ncbi:MAG: hypothetical protein HOP28_14580 [Gemmatimonadales bacterium]|nr:hypothetical protein [Gemmatimonadales bacterium]
MRAAIRRGLVITGLGLALPAVAGAQPGHAAEALADRMLSALGGRDNWAAMKSLVNDSQQNRATDPTVVRAVITMDLTRRRFRIETTGPGLHLIRVVDGDAHWRRTRDGKIGPIPDDFLADDLRWHGAHVYRTIHRIARRDPALTVAVGGDGRLEAHEGGRRLAWFRLDSQGEPFAFGAYDDEVGSISGPWVIKVKGIAHPAWTASPDGTWRALLRSIDVSVPLDDSQFVRPAGP